MAGGDGKSRNKSAGKGRGGNSKKSSSKGGPRRFVTSAEDMEARNRIENEKQEARRRHRQEDDDNDTSDNDDSSNDENISFNREEMLQSIAEDVNHQDIEVEKPTGIAAIINIENPNIIKKQNKVMKAKDMETNFEQKLSRREREAIEKQQATERYKKKHLAGETEEAKKDLARLAEVKKRREEAALKKQQMEEGANERDNARNLTKNDTRPELSARVIKALKPSILKEYLKERGLSIEGQKKDLIQRLIDYENEKKAL